MSQFLGRVVGSWIFVLPHFPMSIFIMNNSFAYIKYYIFSKRKKKKQGHHVLKQMYIIIQLEGPEIQRLGWGRDNA